MELWGHVQNVMESSRVHQLLAQLEENYEDKDYEFCREDVPLCG